MSKFLRGWLFWTIAVAVNSLDTQEPPLATGGPITAPGNVIRPAEVVRSSSAPTPLNRNLLYVVESDVEMFTRQFGAGKVRVDKIERPKQVDPNAPVQSLLIYGTFVDNPTVDGEQREFKKNHVYRVFPVTTGDVELCMIPQGVTQEEHIQVRTIDVQLGPRPPPVNPVDPPVPVIPNPALGNSPWPDKGLRVLVVYKDFATLPRNQQNAIASRTVRDYLDRVCVKGEDGKTTEKRFFEIGTNVDGESEFWRREFKKRSDIKVPTIVIGDGTKGCEVPLPSNPDEVLELVKKFGGV